MNEVISGHIFSNAFVVLEAQTIFSLLEIFIWNNFSYNNCKVLALKRK